MEDKKKVADITEREAKAFNKLAICRAAVEQVVHSAIREWETVSIAESELWRVLARRYALDLVTVFYTVDEAADGAWSLYELPRTDEIARQSAAAKERVREFLGEDEL